MNSISLMAYHWVFLPGLLLTLILTLPKTPAKSQKVTDVLHTKKEMLNFEAILNCFFSASIITWYYVRSNKMLSLIYKADIIIAISCV